MTVCPFCNCDVKRFGCGTIRMTDKNGTKEQWICYSPIKFGKQTFAEGLADLAKLKK